MKIAREPKTRSRCRIDVACLLAAAFAGATSLPANAFAWSESVVYSFTGGTDGANPIAGLTFDGTSTLYGAAFFGGANGQGTLFSIPTSGGTPTVLHAFNSTGDGAGPGGTPILDSSGTNLLGTTAFASINGSHVGSGNGTVYAYSTSGASYNVVHAFSGGSTDGANPYAGLITGCPSTITPLSYAFGPTTAGGSSNAGMLFQLAPSSSSPGGYSYSSLYSVSGVGGQNAYGPLACDGYSKLYGATVLGGSAYRGLAFRISTSGGSPVAINQLSGSGYGGQPRSGFYVLDGSHLFGTTTVGGTYGKGAVYELVYAGGTTYNYTAIYNFGATSSDGSAPWATLIVDSSGNLYGTTVSGGASGNGTAFELVKGASGYTYTQIYSFAGGSDGANPYAALTIDGSGHLYGTTQNGGANGYGTIFKLTP